MMALEHWRAMAAKQGDDTVHQPLDNGVLGPQVMQLRPRFILSLGLGTPYLFLGTFSGAISKLPRSGMWMVTVRKIFGLILLGMALYFLLPLLGNRSVPILAAFLVCCAAYLIAWEARRTKPKQFAWVLRGIGGLAALTAVFFIVPKQTGP